MVPNYRLLASLFILNIATSLYAKKQTQPTDDNEGKKTEAPNNPPALSTGRDFIVHFDKLTKQNGYNKAEDKNEITEEDDDRIWIYNDDNIDEILGDTTDLETDETNNYELTNPEGETKKTPKLADARKKDEKENKKQRKTKENLANFTNTVTTVQPEEIEKDEIVDNTNPTKSEIHAYNTVKKQESQVSITFSNDGDNNKKSNDVTAFKNKDNSLHNSVLQKLLNLLLSNYVAGTTKNMAPSEILAILKDQQKLGKSPVSDAKSIDLNTLTNNADKSNRYPKKTIELDGENNNDTYATNDTPLQANTAIDKTPAPISGSKFLETSIVQNRIPNKNNYPVLPRNLLTIINTGIIEGMQAIVPLRGHNLIFNDKTVNPGIHIVTANVTDEDYIESVAEMISSLSFEKKADLKLLGKKAKKRLVQTLIRSIEKGMILIINSGSINGLNLRLPGTDPQVSKVKPNAKNLDSEIATTKLDSEITTNNLDSKITTENLGFKSTTENLNLETTTENSSTEINTTDRNTAITSKNPGSDNTTSIGSNTETIIPSPKTEEITQTSNIEITSTEPDTESTTTDQNSNDEITSDTPNVTKNVTNEQKLNVKNTSQNINQQLTTEHLKAEDISKKPREKVTDVTVSSKVSDQHPKDVNINWNGEDTTENLISENINENYREVTNDTKNINGNLNPNGAMTKGYPGTADSTENLYPENYSKLPEEKITYKTLSNKNSSPNSYNGITSTSSGLETEVTKLTNPNRRSEDEDTEDKSEYPESEITTEYSNYDNTSSNCHVTSSTSNIESSSQNCSCGVTNIHIESEISTEHIYFRDNSQKPEEELTTHTLNKGVLNLNSEITPDYSKHKNTQQYSNNEVTTARMNSANTSGNSGSGVRNNTLNNNSSKSHINESTDKKKASKNSKQNISTRPSIRSSEKTPKDKNIIISNPPDKSNSQNTDGKIIIEHTERTRAEIITTENFLDHDSANENNKPTENVNKSTDSEINNDNDNHINKNFYKSRAELIKENLLWHINHILPHNKRNASANLDKPIYWNKHNSNIKRRVINENALSNIDISSTNDKNSDIRTTDTENHSIITETEGNGIDTIGNKLKRDTVSNFPMLGLLERVNDAKKIKHLISYLQLLLDFAEKSDKENVNESSKREYYEEEEEDEKLLPIYTKF